MGKLMFKKCCITYKNRKDNKMKDKNKLSEILSFAIAMIVYIILGVAILVESKWVYALILLTAVLMLWLIRKDRFNILKLWAISMLIYSVLVLLGINGVDLLEKTNGNPVVAMLMVVVEMFALLSGRIVLLILVVGIILINPIVKCIRIALADMIYGPLPDVRGIVKQKRKVYFSHAYNAKQIQVIFRNGSQKRILDIYETEGILPSEEHYSLEWKEENELIVRKYNVYNHDVIMEKRYKVPHY